MRKVILVLLLLRVPVCLAAPQEVSRATFNVRQHGAVGDGKTLDSPAINKTIEAAAAAGGGTVLVPPGTYLCGSIRLKSNIDFHLEKGAVIFGDKWNSTAYDPTEPFTPPAFQDGGHTLFHNSLIWGENLSNVAITGPGMINGGGLTNWQGKLNEVIGYKDKGPIPTGPTPPVYAANKAVALKLCKGVTIRDVTIFHGGWFAILVTGCDDMVLDNLTIDTDRDGIDIDCCHNVTVSNCRVNSPFDDAICPKSTYALGEPRLTENLTIINCQVSGFKEGTLLDGTMQPDPRDHRNGRIKFGTESSGGFRNCVIKDCTFLSCMGFALEEVDGGILENITATNLTMTDVKNYAIYITTGRRNRTPNLTTHSRMKNVMISDVVADGVDTLSGIQIFGLPEQPLEDIRLKNIRIVTKGGGTHKDAERVPKELDKDYPDPAGKPMMPAYGVFARHVKNLQLSDITLRFMKEELRPAAKFMNIEGLTLDKFEAQVAPGIRVAEFAPDVEGVVVRNSPGIERSR